MIKQKVFICILLSILLMLSACSHSSDPSDTSSSRIISDASLGGDISSDNSSFFSVDDIKNAEIIEENEHYKVVYWDFMYYYNIFDENHRIVKSDGPLSRKPNILMVSDHLVRFTLQAGTGIGTQWGYYYDTKMDMLSSIFQCIFDQCNGKVAYGGVNKVIVRDIFDETKYFFEISSFKESFSNVVEPITNVEFTDSGASVKVSYLTGVNYQEISENFDLN